MANVLYRHIKARPVYEESSIDKPQPSWEKNRQGITKQYFDLTIEHIVCLYVTQLSP